MISPRPPQMRYATAARRAVARRAALVALVVVPGVACGTNDAQVFESAEAGTSATAASPDTAVDPAVDAASTAGSGEATAEPAAADPVTAETTTVDSPTAAASGLFPASAELAVSFSFVAESNGGRGIENPYIAVWVEDLDGNLVQTISLWYEQSGKGGKWLSDLPQWYSASGQGSDVTMSGATQVAGDYTVVWDGTGLDGQPVAQGDYVLFVEAAREHGPYGVTSQPITIGAEAFTVTLDDAGELAGLSASLLA